MGWFSFGPGALAFLAGLSAHHDKAWFDAHHDDYDAHFVASALASAEALGRRLLPVHRFMDAVLREQG